MVFLECNTDVFLVKKLGIGKKRIRHEGSKGNVVDGVEKSKEAAIGVVDEDPGSAQPKAMEEYEEEERRQTVQLLARRTNKAKKIVVILPRLEDWLVRRAATHKIDPKDFHLPNNPEDLHELHIDTNKNYQAFVEAIIATNDEEVVALKQWLLKGDR